MHYTQHAHTKPKLDQTWQRKLQSSNNTSQSSMSLYKEFTDHKPHQAAVSTKTLHIQNHILPEHFFILN